MEKPTQKIYSGDVLNFLAEQNFEISVSDFVRAALYHPRFGYYSGDRKRVGTEGADFYTAESLKENVFGDLVEQALRTIFKETGADFDKTEIVEIAPENGVVMIGRARTIALGDKLEISPKSAVISSELLDAQPFDAFVFSGGKWRKVFLQISEVSDEKPEEKSFSISEYFAPPSDREDELLRKYFSQCRSEGFRAEISTGAIELFKKICSMNAGGVCLFADYFRNQQEISAFFDGTARSYRQHKCYCDIFENAGFADITFSPCSDIFLDIAKDMGLQNCACTNQEKFFMDFAAEEIKKILENASPLDPRKRELCQLLSPNLMGNIFRVLSVY